MANNLSEFVRFIHLSDTVFSIFLIFLALITISLWWLTRQRPEVREKVQAGVLLLLLAGTLLVNPLLTVLLIAGYIALQRWPVQIPDTIPDWAWLAPLAIITRLPRLFDPLWYDKAFTAYLTRLPADRLGEAMLQGDVHPPLWSVLEWLWTSVAGRSEVALRFPAFLLGIAIVFLSYRLVLALGLDRSVARWTGLLVAVVPTQIYFSDEARVYTLLTFLVLGMLIAILENRPVWFMVCGGLCGWTHNLGYVYLAVIGLTALLYHRNLRWLLGVVGAGLISSIWLPFLLVQTRDVTQGYWIPKPTLPGVFRPIATMTIGNTPDFSALLLVYTPALLMTAFGLYQARNWLSQRRGLVWMALVIGVPVMIIFASIVWQPMYLSRTLLPCATALLILWAWLADQRRFARLLVLMGTVIGLWVFFSPAGNRVTLQDVFTVCDDADGAYFIDTTVHIAADYYLHVDNQLLWQDAYNYADGLSPEAVHGLGFNQGEISQMQGQVCLFYLNTILRTDREQAEFERILQTYPDYQRLSEDGANVDTYLIDMTG